MYLKEIRAQGFKSFADKTSIELNKGITGVVGPNGSGKSNVVDAVRWVLGEQSVKALRGTDSMTDVIFGGSKSRSASNVASVTLIFDNTDNYLPLAFNEISVRRRLYKDGTNEYYLNEEKVRLKDIQNLFLDSGIGKDSFNIISQGKIDEILSSKPEDRRGVFEEAAGVLKYKKRKEEALRKLDKTNDNIIRVDDIIKELESQVEPLREQKEKALKYNDLEDELKNIEIALITNDITNINYQYQDKMGKIDILKKEILELSTTNTNNEAIIEDYKLKISKKEEEIKQVQDSLLSITSEVEQINAKKTILLERQKYNVEDSKLHDNIINLKESILKLENNINSAKLELDTLTSSYSLLLTDIKSQLSELNRNKEDKTKLDNELTNYVRTENNLKNIIANLTEAIENNSNLPYAVKSILSNPKLRGIHDVIGNLIDTPNEYKEAISNALGQSSSFIVIENEFVAKDAVNYLKNNNLGRATFFPLNIIKGKMIPKDILEIVSKLPGFINIASNLVTYDPKYKEIILNQLGNIIIVDTIDNANNIARKINYSYRIVTLDGELLSVGGSITGGRSKVRNIITDKYELEQKQHELDNVITKIKDIEDKINIISTNIGNIDDKLYLLNKDRIEKETYINNKTSIITDYKTELNKLNNELMGTNNIINKNVSNEEEQILADYYKAVNKKEEIIHELDNLNRDKSSLSEALSNYEFTLKKENSLHNQKSEELKNLEIETNRMDVKLDNLLVSLSENYSMTYEKANSLYHLELDESKARSKVAGLKREIKELGPINPDAPSLYEQVSTRYEFLIKQRDDLVNAKEILLQIISEMDQVMIQEFTRVFEIIKDNFSQTFKELFKGGYANLKLSDKDNILESGIEIEACPPGKTLKNINLLSGGEKTFTAVSLLFAILKSRVMPFCILDEVEAALDEANVASFGEYVTGLKNQTQFILITHKKKTMEYADVLYGITMQESGVSKLVSVKLGDMKG